MNHPIIVDRPILDTSSDAHSSHLLEIDVLRGVAISLTLIAHLAFMQVTPSKTYLYVIDNIAQFWGGVYLFFVISGYVISRGFLDELSRQRGTTSRDSLLLRKRFYLRRFFRIVPTAMTWIFVTVLLGLFFNSHNSFGSTESILLQAMAASLFIYNAAMPWIGGAAFGIYWSLSFEEQFYILLPFFGGFSRIVQLSTLVTLIFVFGMIHRPADQSRLITSFPVDALCWGILIFMLQENASTRKLEPKFLKNDTLKLANLLISVLFIVLSPVTLKNFSFGTGFMILPAAWLVFCSSFEKSYVLGNGKANNFLRWMGRASFSLYCCHMPAFLLTRELVQTIRANSEIHSGLVNYLSFVFAAFFCLLFSFLSLKFIENPSRSYSRKISAPIPCKTPSIDA